MYRINTHCFNFALAVLLGLLLLHFIYCPTSFAAAYLLEMPNLAKPCTCLAICWALSQLVQSPQYLHGCCDVQPTGALVVSSFAIFDTFILLKCLDSVSEFKTAPCTLYTSTLFAQASTPPLVIGSSLLVTVSSFYNFFQHVFVFETVNEFLFELSIYLLVIALYCCYAQPSHPLFHAFIIIAV